MYWWDYAAFQFSGMFAVGLLIGWAVTEARAAAAKRRRVRRPRPASFDQRLAAELVVAQTRLAMACRLVEKLENEMSPLAPPITSMYQARLAPPRGRAA